jgi:hypothetical protein
MFIEVDGVLTPDIIHKVKDKWSGEEETVGKCKRW